MSANLNQNLKIQTDISVIICTHNRCNQLKVVLNSLLNQITSKSCQYEIIVVDNNSNDQTKDVIESYKLKFKNRLIYAFEPKPGLSYARNKGIREAKGKIIAFTDDDCLIDENWVQTIFNCAKEVDFDALGGKILPDYPSETPEWIKANADLIPGPLVYHDYGDKTVQYKIPMTPMFGANMAFKRGVFEKIGTFRTDLGAGQGVMGEDTEFINRLSKESEKIYYCGKSMVWHPAITERMTLKYIAQWNIAYGKYRVVKAKGKVDQNIVRYGNVPRYLFRRILGRGLGLIISIFNKRNFLLNWVNLFREIGSVKAYREYGLSTSKGM